VNRRCGYRDAIELEDDTVVLRPWREDDAPHVHAGCQDADLQRWLPDLPREGRGRGIATRALRRVSRYGHEDLALERLELTTDIENLASQRVAEKVGFEREGVLRSHVRHPDGYRRDSIMFSLLPDELR